MTIYLPVIQTVAVLLLLRLLLDLVDDVDLCALQLILFLLQPFLDRYQKHQALNTSCQTLPQLSLLGGLAVSQ